MAPAVNGVNVEAEVLAILKQWGSLAVHNARELDPATDEYKAAWSKVKAEVEGEGDNWNSFLTKFRTIRNDLDGMLATDPNEGGEPNMELYGPVIWERYHRDCSNVWEWKRFYALEKIGFERAI